MMKLFDKLYSLELFDRKFAAVRIQAAGEKRHPQKYKEPSLWTCIVLSVLVLARLK